MLIYSDKTKYERIVTKLRGHNWAFFPKGHCYLGFKLCYLKNLKWFSIGIKELFEPIYCLTTAEGSNDHFHVFEIWHKNQILPNLSNI